MTPTQQNSALTELCETLEHWGATPEDVAVIAANLRGEMEARAEQREKEAA